MKREISPGEFVDAPHPVFLFLFTNVRFLVSAAITWATFWVWVSARSEDWTWFARSGSGLAIIGGILSARSVLRMSRAERMRIRNMNIVEVFSPSETDDQERDSNAMQIGVFLLLVGTLAWAYGDLLPKLWH